MEALARSFITTARELDIEADFLTAHQQFDEALTLRNHARFMRERAVRCYAHARTLQQHASAIPLKEKDPVWLKCTSFKTLMALFTH